MDRLHKTAQLPDYTIINELSQAILAPTGQYAKGACHNTDFEEVLTAKEANDYQPPDISSEGQDAGGA